MALKDAKWLCEELGLSSEHRAYKLARDGIVPCVHLGRTIRFDEDTVRRFIKEGGKSFEGGWRREKQ